MTKRQLTLSSKNIASVTSRNPIDAEQAIHMYPLMATSGITMRVRMDFLARSCRSAKLTLIHIKLVKLLYHTTYYITFCKTY